MPNFTPGPIPDGKVPTMHTVPEGYEVVTSGLIKENYLWWNDVDFKYVPAGKRIGDFVSVYHRVLRPVPTKKGCEATWKKMPETFGFYFYTTSLQYWDSAKVVCVERRQSGCDKVKYYANDKLITESTGFWQGPFYPVKPF